MSETTVTNIDLSAIELNKTSIENRAKDTAAVIHNGYMKPLDALQQIKAVEKFIELLKPLISEAILDEAAKYGGKSFEYNGCKMNIQEVGTRYDFKGCGDVIWNRLNESLKEREAILKALKSPLESIDPETGEIYFAKPPIKTSTTSVVTTFK